MQHYITYSIPFNLQKTREWSPTPSSRYTFENSASGWKGGQISVVRVIDISIEAMIP